MHDSSLTIIVPFWPVTFAPAMQPTCSDRNVRMPLKQPWVCFGGGKANPANALVNPPSNEQW